MKIANTHSDLLNQIQGLKTGNPGAKVGFVPTMGALHEGHLSLINAATSQCEIVVVSIFVNPTQFNNKVDLDKYPRTLSTDVDLLETTACSVLFHPSEETVYPENHKSIDVDLIGLDEVMEGAFRPGHFKGVINVVNRLFELVNPDLAFFGKKDFQQLAIIRQMVSVRNWNIEIVPVNIKRADSGLALSSRNARLSEIQLRDALIIYNTLLHGRDLFKSEYSPSRLKAQLVQRFDSGILALEYLEIVNPNTLLAAKESDNQVVCCIAAQCGEVRLIDNMEFSRD